MTRNKVSVAWGYLPLKLEINCDNRSMENLNRNFAVQVILWNVTIYCMSQESIQMKASSVTNQSRSEQKQQDDPINLNWNKNNKNTSTWMLV